jgi:hypothetical protein
VPKGEPWTDRNFRSERFLEQGLYMLATTPGGRDLLRAVVDPDLADLVAQLQPQGIPAVRASRPNPLIVAGMQVMGGVCGCI